MVWAAGRSPHGPVGSVGRGDPRAVVGASAGSGRTVPRSRPAPPGSQARLRARARAWRGAPRRQAIAPAGPWEGAVTWRRLSLAVAGEQLGPGLQDKPGPRLGGAAAQAALPAQARRPLSPPHSSAFLCGARGPPACCAGLWADGGRRGRRELPAGGLGEEAAPPPPSAWPFVSARGCRDQHRDWGPPSSEAVPPIPYLSVCLCLL